MSAERREENQREKQQQFRESSALERRGRQRSNPRSLRRTGSFGGQTPAVGRRRFRGLTAKRACWKEICTETVPD